MARYSELGLHDHFMRVALITALRSKDPSTKVGSCIVDKNERIVGTGFNRFPKTLPEHANKYQPNQEYTNEDELLKTKHPYIIYADMNAIMNKKCSSLEGCTIYTLLFPWNEGAKMIVESGIKKVVYYSDKHIERDFSLTSKNMLEWAGVKCEKFVSEIKENDEVLIMLARKTVEIPTDTSSQEALDQ